VAEIKMPGKKVKRVDHQSATAVVAGRSPLKYERGQPIFRQGDAADAVFYIQRGKVQITVLSEQGKEGVIGMLDAGQFFGKGCLAGQPLYLASATATADSAIVRIPKYAMVRALHDEPAHVAAGSGSLAPVEPSYPMLAPRSRHNQGRMKVPRHIPRLLALAASSSSK
jgi:CRP-like cAMP-binding protein